jgi:hypothetical protein
LSGASSLLIGRRIRTHFSETPGCGKTVLNSTIIENVFHNCRLDSTPAADSKPIAAVAYFYFDFNDVEKQSHEKMVRPLVTQLSTQSKGMPQELESIFSPCMGGRRQPTADALLTTLRQMIQEFNEIFLVLDALDECAKRASHLRTIQAIVEWKLEKLHILVTSRGETDVEDLLDTLVNDQEKICIQSAIVNDDICAYIHERLQTDLELKRWQKHPKVLKEIETTLMSKAGGM